MKPEELKALKPGTKVYILFGYFCSADWSRVNQNIEKGTFEGIYNGLPGSTGPQLVLLQSKGLRGLGYEDRIFLTKEDAEMALIESLLKW